MKAVCIQTCQIRNDSGQIVTCEQRKVYDLEESNADNKNFKPLEDSKGEQLDVEIDFIKASQEELTNTKWAFKDAKDAMKASYDQVLKKASREEVIEQIMDIRYRSVNNLNEASVG